jgi:hypothetical protein
MFHIHTGIEDVMGPGKLSQYSNLATGWTVRGSNPDGDKIFRTLQTGPVAHPASYTVGTGTFLAVKWTGRGLHHPPTSSVEVKETVEQHLYSPSGAFVACYMATFTFTFITDFV